MIRWISRKLRGVDKEDPPRHTQVEGATVVPGAAPQAGEILTPERMSDNIRSLNTPWTERSSMEDRPLEPGESAENQEVGDRPANEPLPEMQQGGGAEVPATPVNQTLAQSEHQANQPQRTGAPAQVTLTCSDCGRSATVSESVGNTAQSTGVKCVECGGSMQVAQ